MLEIEGSLRNDLAVAALLYSLIIELHAASKISCFNHPSVVSPSISVANTQSCGRQNVNSGNLSTH